MSKKPNYNKGQKIPYTIYKFWVVGNSGPGKHTHALVEPLTKNDNEETLLGKANELFGDINSQPEGVRSYNWANCEFKTMEALRYALHKAHNEKYLVDKKVRELEDLEELINAENYRKKIKDCEDIIPVSLSKATFSQDNGLRYTARKAVDDISYKSHLGVEKEAEIKEIIRLFNIEYRQYQKNNKE